jgi:enoyl-CoA hydratase
MTLRVDRAAGRYEITLDRPAKRNALNRELDAALAATLREFAADDSARVAVLTGTDPAFCAGMDLTELSWTERSHDTFSQALRDVGKPVIAAVNGPAITGGFELALGCDFVVASERAYFGDTHARVGVFPGGGMTVHLAEAVGVRRARQMSYTGELIDAAEALRLGLVNEVVPHAGLLPRAHEIADATAEIEPSLLADLRAAYHRRANLGVDDALDAERADSRRRNAGPAGIAAARAGVIARGRQQLRR